MNSIDVEAALEHHHGFQRPPNKRSWTQLEVRRLLPELHMEIAVYQDPEGAAVFLYNLNEETGSASPGFSSEYAQITHLVIPEEADQLGIILDDIAILEAMAQPDPTKCLAVIRKRAEEAPTAPETSWMMPPTFRPGEPDDERTIKRLQEFLAEAREELKCTEEAEIEAPRP